MGEAIAVVALTVLMSVVLYGVSAGPFDSRYVRAEATEPEPAGPDVARARRVGHRHHAHRLHSGVRRDGRVGSYRGRTALVHARTEEWPGEQPVGLPSRRVGLP